MGKWRFTAVRRQLGELPLMVLSTRPPALPDVQELLCSGTDELQRENGKFITETAWQNAAHELPYPWGVTTEEKEKEFVVRVELPGFAPEEVKVELLAEWLTVPLTPKTCRTRPSASWGWREYGCGHLRSNGR